MTTPKTSREFMALRRELALHNVEATVYYTVVVDDTHKDFMYTWKCKCGEFPDDTRLVHKTTETAIEAGWEHVAERIIEKHMTQWVKDSFIVRNRLGEVTDAMHALASEWETEDWPFDRVRTMTIHAAAKHLVQELGEVGL